MKKTGFLFLVFFFTLNFQQKAYCQNLCGSDNIAQVFQNTDSATMAKLYNFNPINQQPQAQYQNKASGSRVRTVPVVFHIIHNNGPENIPDSLIYQQLAILNEDFRKLPGTPGFGAGVDTRIEFCLAKIDTAGNVTSGITRTQSVCTDASLPGCGSWPANIIYWDDSARRYLNIWISKSLGGVKGYGSPKSHAWIRYDCVGRGSIYNGRVATHEAGHWLNLNHTFDGGCGTADCYTSGDYVCDTPPVASPNGNCGVVNSCSNDVPDLPDQVENYMDYSGNCYNMFTQGQKNRMYGLLDNPWTSHNYITSDMNLKNTGCNTCASPLCPPVVDFQANKTLASIRDTISYSDMSYNAPTSLLWSFPGGNPSTDTVKNPIVIYDSAGTYDVTLIAVNATGSDTLTKQGYINVVAHEWSDLDTGMNGIVFTLAVYNNELYAGGSFTKAGGKNINNIAKWNGKDWYGLGTGTNSTVSSLTVYQNELYVGGDFTNAGGISVQDMARWNGNSWSAVNSGLTGGNGVAVYNNELYIVSYKQLFKWNGTNLTLVTSANKNIRKACTFSNQLYVIGDFDTINNVSTNTIVRFDGTNWYPVSSGVFIEDFWGFQKGYVYDIVANDSALYIGGLFNNVNGLSTNLISRWDGGSWYAVAGLPFPYPFPSFWVNTLLVWGNSLFAGGNFDKTIVNSFNHIASLNNSSWSDMGAGTNSSINALTVWNNELYAGGSFTVAGGDSAYYIAKWGCSLNAEFTQSADTVDLAASGAVQFTDSSAKAVKWFWDFGDGATDTTKNPVHVYNQPGSYKVTLSASNGTCLSTDSSVVVVKWDCYPLSIAYQQSMDTIDIALAPDTVNFTSQTFFTDSILWNFGDGAKDTTQNPSHIYPAVMGIYNVSLTGYMDTCSNFATSKVIICSKPKAIFAKNKDTVDLAVSGVVQFTNSSTNAYLWNWNFGDATTATALNPAHTYTKTGTFTVTLSASDSVCVNNATTTVVVVNTSGISKSENALQYKISPNPTAGAFTLALSIPDKQDLFISVTNILGQEVFSEKLMQVFGAYQKEMDLGNVPKGFYILRIRGERDVAVAKVVVQ